MNQWYLSYSKDGFTAVLREESLWATVLSSVSESSCGLTGHLLCGGHSLNFLWQVPLGLPKWDKSEPNDPYLENSVAAKLADLGNWFMAFDHRHGRDVVRLPVSKENGISIWNRAEDSWLWEDTK